MTMNSKQSPTFSVQLLTVTALALTLSACASFRGPAFQMAEKDRDVFNQPLRDPKTIETQSLYGEQNSEEQKPGLAVTKAPSLNIKQQAENAKNEFIPKITAGNVSQLAFSDLPVPTFINEVFGNQLNLNFVIEPAISTVPDLVTMRIANPITKKDLYDLAVNTLNNYGVVTSSRDGTLVFDYAANALDGTVPLLVSGRTLPDVPASSRPVFYIYPLDSVTTPQVRGVLVQMFPKAELEINEDITRNALIFKGRPSVVRQAVDATNILDKPSMEGMFSSVLRPNMTDVSELAVNLESVLKAEGYEVSQKPGQSPIRLLPLESVDQLIVFAKSREVLNHVISWARMLETERQSKIEQGLFTYQVQSTQATEIVKTLDSLGVTNQRASSNSSSGNNSSSGANKSSSVATGRYAVNEQLNMILFSGSGKEWLQLLPIIQQLDRPAPSVLVEVILAEVQLGEEENSGVEWLFNSSIDSASITGSTIGNLIGGSGTALGLTASKLVGDSMQTRAILNFLYSDRNVTIRSRPRVMVKSGSEASINVVTEIPIVTSNGQSVNNADAPIIQNFAYRSTGVILDIKPTVHATGYVDIEVSQELSQQANTDGNAGNPTILNRNLQTTVTLKDGGSVLIGGLISSSKTDGQRGVPILGKLPLLGNLFHSDTTEVSRTELMIMIIPYVLTTPEEAEALGDELQQKRMAELDF